MSIRNQPCDRGNPSRAKVSLSARLNSCRLPRAYTTMGHKTVSTATRIPATRNHKCATRIPRSRARQMRAIRNNLPERWGHSKQSPAIVNAETHCSTRLSISKAAKIPAISRRQVRQDVLIVPSVRTLDGPAASLNPLVGKVKSTTRPVQSTISPGISRADEAKYGRAWRSIISARRRIIP